MGGVSFVNILSTMYIINIYLFCYFNILLGGNYRNISLGGDDRNICSYMIGTYIGIMTGTYIG